MIDFGCERFYATAEPEWLVTNGIGGYASGSVSGCLNSRYHGLLIAALKPPLGRTLLLSKFDEQVRYAGVEYSLAANHFLTQGQIISPYLSRFHMDGTIPIWTFAFADALLEKRIWMPHGENTTYIQYTVIRALESVTLNVHPLVNYRDSHFNSHIQDWMPEITSVPNGITFTAFKEAATLYLSSDRAQFTQNINVMREYVLAIELGRGLDHLDDNISVGIFELMLNQGKSVTFIASTHPIAAMNAADSAYRNREQTLLTQSSLTSEPEWIQRLVLAADQFIVSRPLPDHPDGLTVLAGYPWFSDWGRDTMIALPGLTLATGRYKVAANILRTFARFLDQGMLPNRFPDEGEQPEYNTVDATLWYFQAVRQYVAATGDLVLLRELYPILVDIVAWHERGTRFNIHVDPIDGLLVAGEPDVQLTWMDVKIHTRYLPVDRLRAADSTLWLPAFLGLLQMFGVETPNWVVTPRTGKQIEINALWYNALLTLADFAQQLGGLHNDYAQKALRVKESFGRFWNIETNYCFDVIDTPDSSNDPTLRPNQLFAVSLPYSPFTQEQQRQIVDICAQKLVTPYGLRSLTPDHPDYQGSYGGNLVLRDAAYHQGTVWSWLIGAFVEAHLRVYQDKATARSFLVPFQHHLSDHGLGSISEVFSGDAPHTPGGCLAQAWGVAEVLRAWLLCQ